MVPIVIKASWFGSHDYCEWKWYLENVLKEKIPRTKSMTIGKKVHEKKEKEFLKDAKPTTIKKFLASKKYAITKEILLKTKFTDLTLIGKIDELGIDKKKVYVIEDKPRAHPWLGTKRQIWAYCLLFKENFPKLNKQIIAVLRDRDSNEKVWDEPFDETYEEHIHDIMDRMKALFRKKVNPMPCQNSNKCRACILHKKNICNYSCASWF